MASNGQKLGNLMLHSANNHDDSISFVNPRASRVSKIPVPASAFREDDQNQVSVSASSADGQGATGRTLSFQKSHFGHSIISVTCKGYISSGTYYWAWAIKNTTTGNFLPLLMHGMGSYSSSAKTRTVSTIQGNQTHNCVVPYVGGVHTNSSQNWASFDASNESNGDTFQFWFAADDGAGSTWYANASQTLYVSEIIWAYGTVQGIQYDHVLHGS